jgi:hypothetical protein
MVFPFLIRLQELVEVDEKIQVFWNVEESHRNEQNVR